MATDDNNKFPVVNAQEFMDRTSNPDLSFFPSPRQYAHDDTSSISLVPQAFIENELVVGSLFANQLGTTGEIDKSFNYEDHLTPDLEPFSYEFVKAKNQKDFELIEANIRRQQTNRQILAEHPLATMGVGLLTAPLDLMNYIPGGIFYSRIKEGSTFLKTATTVGLSQMAATGVNEAVLLEQQATRTIGESIFNTAADGIFAGLVSGVGHAALLRRAKFTKEVGEDLEGAVTGNPKTVLLDSTDPITGEYKNHPNGISPDGTVLDARFVQELDNEEFLPEGSTAGAQQVARTVFDEEAKDLEISGVGGVIARLSGNLNPIVALSNSDYVTGKRASMAIFGQNIRRNKNAYDAIGAANEVSLENMIANSEGRVQNLMTKVTDLFYKQAGFTEESFKGVKQFVRSKTGKAIGLSEFEFYQRMGIAIRNGFTDPVDEVNQGARLIFNDVFEISRKEGVKLNIFPENMPRRVAVNYLTRLYNKQQILENRPGFVNQITPWFKEKNEQLKGLMPAIEAKKAAITTAKRAVTTQEKREKKLVRLKKQVEGEAGKKLERDIAELEKQLDKLTAQKIDQPEIFRVQTELRDAKQERGKLRARITRFENAGNTKEANKARKELNRRNGIEFKIKRLEKQLADLQKRVKDERGIGKIQTQLSALRAKRTQQKADLKKLTKDVAGKSSEKAKEQLAALQEEFASDEFVPAELRHSDGTIRKPLDDDSHIAEQVDQTIENILGENAERLISRAADRGGQQSKPSPLKNLAFLIPDEILEDWLINDAREVVHQYNRMMSPHIESAKFAERLGINKTNEKKVEEKLAELDEISEKLEDEATTEEQAEALHAKSAELEQEIADLKLPASGEDIIVHYTEELQAEFEQLSRGKDGKEIDRLAKQRDLDIENVAWGVRFLNNTLSNNSMLSPRAIQFLNDIKKYNTSRLMGSVLPASLADAGGIVARHGYGEAVAAFARQVSGDIAAIQNRETLQDLGFALNRRTSMLAKRIFELDDTEAAKGKFSTFADFTSNAVFSLGGMNHWQDLAQNIAGDISISRTLRAIDGWVKTGKIEQGELARLNTLGIDKAHWQEIHNQWQQHGGKSNGGSYYINYGNMDIEERGGSAAYQAFMSGLRNEVTSTIVEPGAGDIAKFIRRPEASAATQFKRFSLATHNKTLISNLSQADGNTWTGIATMLALGATSYIVTSYLRDGGESLDLSLAKLMDEAIDRSGFIALIWGSKNLTFKALGLGTSSRYNSRGVFSAFTGPTVGLAEDALALARKVIASMRDPSEDGYRALTDKDAKLFLRMIPFQNLFYLMYLNRQMTKNIALSLGAEEA